MASTKDDTLKNYGADADGMLATCLASAEQLDHALSSVSAGTTPAETEDNTPTGVRYGLHPTRLNAVTSDARADGRKRCCRAYQNSMGCLAQHGFLQDESADDHSTDEFSQRFKSECGLNPVLQQEKPTILHPQLFLRGQLALVFPSVSSKKAFLDEHVGTTPVETTSEGRKLSRRELSNTGTAGTGPALLEQLRSFFKDALDKKVDSVASLGADQTHTEVYVHFVDGDSFVGIGSGSGKGRKMSVFEGYQQKDSLLKSKRNTLAMQASEITRRLSGLNTTSAPSTTPSSEQHEHNHTTVAASTFTTTTTYGMAYDHMATTTDMETTLLNATSTTGVPPVNVIFPSEPPGAPISSSTLTLQYVYGPVTSIASTGTQSLPAETNAPGSTSSSVPLPGLDSELWVVAKTPGLLHTNAGIVWNQYLGLGRGGQNHTDHVRLAWDVSPTRSFTVTTEERTASGPNGADFQEGLWLYSWPFIELDSSLPSGGNAHALGETFGRSTGFVDFGIEEEVINAQCIDFMIDAMRGGVLSRRRTTSEVGGSSEVPVGSRSGSVVAVKTPTRRLATEYSFPDPGGPTGGGATSGGLGGTVTTTTAAPSTTTATPPTSTAAAPPTSTAAAAPPTTTTTAAPPTTAATSYTPAATTASPSSTSTSSSGGTISAAALALASFTPSSQFNFTIELTREGVTPDDPMPPVTVCAGLALTSSDEISGAPMTDLAYVPTPPSCGIISAGGGRKLLDVTNVFKILCAEVGATVKGGRSQFSLVLRLDALNSATTRVRFTGGSFVGRNIRESNAVSAHPNPSSELMKIENPVESVPLLRNSFRFARRPDDRFASVARQKFPEKFGTIGTSEQGDALWRARHIRQFNGYGPAIALDNDGNEVVCETIPKLCTRLQAGQGQGPPPEWPCLPVSDPDWGVNATSGELVPTHTCFVPAKLAAFGFPASASLACVAALCAYSAECYGFLASPRAPRISLLGREVVEAHGKGELKSGSYTCADGDFSCHGAGAGVCLVVLRPGERLDKLGDAEYTSRWRWNSASEGVGSSGGGPSTLSSASEGVESSGGGPSGSSASEGVGSSAGGSSGPSTLLQMTEGFGGGGGFTPELAALLTFQEQLREFEISSLRGALERDLAGYLSGQSAARRIMSDRRSSRRSRRLSESTAGGGGGAAPKIFAPAEYQNLALPGYSRGRETKLVSVHRIDNHGAASDEVVPAFEDAYALSLDLEYEFPKLPAVVKRPYSTLMLDGVVPSDSSGFATLDSAEVRTHPEINTLINTVTDSFAKFDVSKTLLLDEERLKICLAGGPLLGGPSGGSSAAHYTYGLELGKRCAISCARADWTPRTVANELVVEQHGSVRSLRLAYRGTGCHPAQCSGFANQAQALTNHPVLGAIIEFDLGRTWGPSSIDELITEPADVALQRPPQTGAFVSTIFDPPEQKPIGKATGLERVAAITSAALLRCRIPAFRPRFQEVRCVDGVMEPEWVFSGDIGRMQPGTTGGQSVKNATVDLQGAPANGTTVSPNPSDVEGAGATTSTVSPPPGATVSPLLSTSTSEPPAASGTGSSSGFGGLTDSFVGAADDEDALQESSSGTVIRPEDAMGQAGLTMPPGMGGGSSGVPSFRRRGQEDSSAASSASAGGAPASGSSGQTGKEQNLATLCLPARPCTINTAPTGLFFNGNPAWNVSLPWMVASGTEVTISCDPAVHWLVQSQGKFGSAEYQSVLNGLFEDENRYGSRYEIFRLRGLLQNDNTTTNGSSSSGTSASGASQTLPPTTTTSTTTTTLEPYYLPAEYFRVDSVQRVCYDGALLPKHHYDSLLQNYKAQANATLALNANTNSETQLQLPYCTPTTTTTFTPFIVDLAKPAEGRTQTISVVSVIVSTAMAADTFLNPAPREKPPVIDMGGASDDPDARKNAFESDRIMQITKSREPTDNEWAAAFWMFTNADVVRGGSIIRIGPVSDRFQTGFRPVACSCGMHSPCHSVAGRICGVHVTVSC